MKGARNVEGIRAKGGYFKKPERVVFGRDEWCVEEIQSHVGASVNIQHKGKRYSNTITQYYKERSPQNLTVQYNGEMYGNEYLQAIANQIVGTLFYIELTELPRCYSSTIRVRLMCCVPSGPACVSLQKKLEGAEIRYRCDTDRYSTRRLRTDSRNNTGFPPSTFDVHIVSLDSTIDVVLRKGSSVFAVTQSPYRVRDLIRDQGIDNLWHPNYQDPQESNIDWFEEDWDQSELHLGNELTALCKTMKQVAHHEVVHHEIVHHEAQPDRVVIDYI
ncbi:uncharacterized protein F4822DRAFT_150572 [Hypoxylon trugodes]|uniref:uncharacterized protein n=1 Tax=Hypoxylon trugodes TaxID=326681 RepID=UPI002191A66D|nr:uncharacterized protein F4822DRAFT_150572 [Hypoxylon trugodes]KAI1382564.1 hypothetical protein F4822DRAFT_150572 [Hypoxylon trugodes]